MDATPQPTTLVAAPNAVAGTADPTRRFALRLPDGHTRYAGIARHEAEAVEDELARRPADEWDRLLIEVALPVVLSDGAGPYLIDALGNVTLVLADHPRIAGAKVAMGMPSPGHRIGAVRRAEHPHIWRWLADITVGADQRIAALTALDDAGDDLDLLRWQTEQRGVAG